MPKRKVIPLPETNNLSSLTLAVKEFGELAGRGSAVAMWRAITREVKTYDPSIPFLADLDWESILVHAITKEIDFSSVFSANSNNSKKKSQSTSANQEKSIAVSNSVRKCALIFWKYFLEDMGGDSKAFEVQSLAIYSVVFESEQRICAVPGCGTVLAKQNKSGYCSKHAYLRPDIRYKHRRTKKTKPTN